MDLFEILKGFPEQSHSSYGEVELCRPGRRVMGYDLRTVNVWLSTTQDDWAGPWIHWVLVPWNLLTYRSSEWFWCYIIRLDQILSTHPLVQVSGIDDEAFQDPTSQTFWYQHVKFMSSTAWLDCQGRCPDVVLVKKAQTKGVETVETVVQGLDMSWWSSMASRCSVSIRVSVWQAYKRKNKRTFGT